MRRFTWDIFDQKLSAIFRVILKVLPLIIESIIIIFLSKLFLFLLVLSRVKFYGLCIQDIHLHVFNFYFSSNMRTYCAAWIKVCINGCGCLCLWETWLRNLNFAVKPEEVWVRSSAWTFFPWYFFLLLLYFNSYQIVVQYIVIKVQWISESVVILRVFRILCFINLPFFFL
jgi:hypothetical protein